MLLDNPWIEKDSIKSKIIEYRRTDFYGPFLTLLLQKGEDGVLIVTPISSRIETPEISGNDFALVSEAAQELYEEEGEFVLKTRLFEVDINSAERAEENLLEKLKDLPLI